MNTLIKCQKEKHTLQTNHYRWGKARDVVSSLLLLDGSVHREVEQHRNAAFDFVPIYLLGLFAGTVGLTPELMFDFALMAERLQTRRHVSKEEEDTTEKWGVCAGAAADLY